MIALLLTNWSNRNERVTKIDETIFEKVLFSFILLLGMIITQWRGWRDDDVSSKIQKFLGSLVCLPCSYQPLCRQPSVHLAHDRYQTRMKGDLAKCKKLHCCLFEKCIFVEQYHYQITSNDNPPPPDYCSCSSSIIIMFMAHINQRYFTEMYFLTLCLSLSFINVYDEKTPHNIN